jgi:hypothetical protein
MDNFDFENDIDEASKIDDLKKRLIFLEERLRAFKRSRYKQFPIVDHMFGLTPYAKAINSEIDAIKELLKESDDTIENDTSKIKSDKIWWQKSERLLKYLLEELARKGFIDRDSNLNKLIKDHFVNKDKNAISDSIKQNFSGTGYNKNLKPKYSDQIDDIIEKLKNDDD